MRSPSILFIDNRYCLDWNSKFPSAQISPSAAAADDDVLNIKYVCYRQTDHTFEPVRHLKAEEKWLRPATTNVIAVHPSELRNLDSANIMQSSSGRMIAGLINTHLPPQDKKYLRGIVETVLFLVQESTPLVPNDFIHVQQIEALEIMHHVDDAVTEAILHDRFQATKRGTCSICLDDYEVGCQTSRLPCLHVFHGPCIFEWLQINLRCPLCQYSLHSVVAPWFNA